MHKRDAQEYSGSNQRYICLSFDSLWGRMKISFDES